MKVKYKKDKRKKSKQNRGITLIALVITIVVILILSGIMISTLTGDNGILTKAGRARDIVNDSELEEKIKLAYQDYYIKKYTDSGYKLQDELSKNGLDIVSVEGSESTGFEIKVNTKNGEKLFLLLPDGTVKIATTEWTYDGKGTYTNGTKQLKVGQEVSYNQGTGYTFKTDASKGMGANVTYNDNTKKYDFTSGTYTTDSTITWKFLGVNSFGQIELISNKPHSVSVALANEEGYYNGAEELNKLCNALYGKGTGAQKARSLNVNDLNILANYKPENDSIVNPRYNKYRKYKFNSDGTYQISDSANGISDWSEWNTISPPFAVDSFRKIGSTEIISKDNPKETSAIKNTLYNYNVKDKIKNEISESFANLIINSNDNQWIATSCVEADISEVVWRIFLLYTDGNLSSEYLYGSYGGMGGVDCLCRPVVTLKSDVTLNWNENTNMYNIQD